MRRAVLHALVLGLAVAVAACGSSHGYADSARSAVASMADAIRTYNGARADNVASTGDACRAALSKLSDAADLPKEKTPARYARAGAALRRAYDSALAGFNDCAAGAARNDFLLMARADAEIASANAAIVEAQRLDR